MKYDRRLFLKSSLGAGVLLGLGQGTAEAAPFSMGEMNTLLAYAQKGIFELHQQQNDALAL